MRCPFCAHMDTKVIDSRNVTRGVRRRRECSQCGIRFTTYERPQETVLLIAKKDGHREEFDRRKVLAGIRKACAKRPVSDEAIERVVDEIEAKLHKLGKAEVASSTVGDMVMEQLRPLDAIAYIRFASVYRGFASIEQVKQEADAYARLQPVQQDTAQLTLFPEEALDDTGRSSADVEPSNSRRMHGDRKKRVGAASL